ncbi:hypothetical protein SVIOM342S_02628 [Streptomyces violaceorubidus]
MRPSCGRAGHTLGRRGQLRAYGTSRDGRVGEQSLLLQCLAQGGRLLRVAKPRSVRLRHAR